MDYTALEMKFTFDTAYINQTWFRKAVWEYIKAMTINSPEGTHYYLKSLKNNHMLVRALNRITDADKKFYQHAIESGVKNINPTVPFGVTGKDEIRAYVMDNKTTDPSMLLMMNMPRVYHELAHELLRIKNYWAKVKLRHNDTSGHKAGTVLKWWSAEVHDVEYEKSKWILATDWKNGLMGRKYRIQLVGPDIRQALTKGPLNIV